MLELELRADSDRYEADDPRFREQVGRLIVELRREAGPVHLRESATPGAKGSEVASVILALGSSGALGIAYRAFKEWLRRDRTRRLRISWTAEDGGRRTLVVQADELDRDGFEELAKLALSLDRPGSAARPEPDQP